jgi:hypothetical protein
MLTSSKQKALLKEEYFNYKKYAVSFTVILDQTKKDG